MMLECVFFKVLCTNLHCNESCVFMMQNDVENVVSICSYCAGHVMDRKIRMLIVMRWPCNCNEDAMQSPCIRQLCDMQLSCLCHASAMQWPCCCCTIAMHFLYICYAVAMLSPNISTSWSVHIANCPVANCPIFRCSCHNISNFLILQYTLLNNHIVNGPIYNFLKAGSSWRRD